jgi:Fic family protein
LTYKSLKWHLLVIWYLNPQIDPDKFKEVAYTIANKNQGFISFNIPDRLLDKIIYEVSMCDLEEPPNNKLRKVIFKPSTLSKEEKLRIVGELIGRSKKVHPDDIYECMLELNNNGESITIVKIAKLLDCSTRTIHRNMPVELKREKELLNQQL